MPKIQVNDISMYYEIHGKGQPVVMIAGFGADHTAWKIVLDRFTRNYQVVLLDNRGIGQTDVPAGDYSIQQMADDVAALCNKLGIEQAHFIGSSMGGCIVQALCVSQPQLVKSAVISNSMQKTQGSFHFYLQAQLELLQHQAYLPAIIKAAASWVYSYQFLSQPGVIDFLLQVALNNPYPFTLAGYQGQFAALQTFDSSAWLNQINAPVLVLGSDQDIVFDAASTKLLAEQIPGAKYHCFENCGHLPFIEYPDKFYKQVVGFLGSSISTVN